MKERRSRTLGKPELTRKINKAQVLDILRRRRTVTRSELVQTTGIQANTISYIVEELIAGGLAKWAGTAQSTGGRQPLLIECRSDGLHVMGIEVEPGQIRGVILDFIGTVIARHSTHLAHTGVPVVLKAVEETAARLLKQVGLSRTHLHGIGIALPGIIAARDHRVLFSRPLAWRDVDLGAEVERRAKVPVRLLNNAMAGAVSLYDTAPYHSQSSLLHYLILLEDAGSRQAAGIGCGIVLNGRPYVGRDHMAGEVATLLKHPIARARGVERGGSIRTMSALLTATRKHPERYRPVWESFARDLAEEVARGISYLNPHAIVIGSDCAVLSPLIKDHLIKHATHLTVAGHLQEEALPTAQQFAPAIDFCELAPEDIARGAALPFILDRTLPPQLDVGVLL